MRQGRQAVEEQPVNVEVVESINPSIGKSPTDSMMSRNFASPDSGESKYLAANRKGTLAARQMQAQHTNRVSLLLETLGA